MSEAVAHQHHVRKERVGEVVSDKMDKTIIVRVKRRYRHPKYGKELTVGKKYYAHDEGDEARTGDIVRIVEMRPMSRLKRWRIVEIVQQSKAVEMPAAVVEAETPVEPASEEPKPKKSARKGKS